MSLPSVIQICNGSRDRIVLSLLQLLFRCVGPQEVKVRGKVFGDKGSPRSCTFQRVERPATGGLAQLPRKNRNPTGRKPETSDEAPPYLVHIQVSNSGRNGWYDGGRPLAQEDPCRSARRRPMPLPGERIATTRGSDNADKRGHNHTRPGFLGKPVADHLARGAVR
jgi:hypothetical protein